MENSRKRNDQERDIQRVSGKNIDPDKQEGFDGMNYEQSRRPFITANQKRNTRDRKDEGENAPGNP